MKYVFRIAVLTVISLALLAVPAEVLAQQVSPTGTPTPTTTGILEATPSVTITDSVTPTVVVTDTPTEAPTPTTTPASQSKIASSVLVKTQYPWNKKIPVVVSITPLVSGSQLQIIWQKRLGMSAAPTTYTIKNPQANVTYTKTFMLSPSAPGSQRTVANIILTTFNSNYVSSVDVPLQFTKNLEVYPKSTQYIVYTVVMWVVIITCFFMLLPYGIYKGFLYFRANIFPKWLESKVQVPQ